MKPGTIAIVVIALIVGYLAADAMAARFAKAHGVRKYGGLFTYTPPEKVS